MASYGPDAWNGRCWKIVVSYQSQFPQGKRLITGYEFLFIIKYEILDGIISIHVDDLQYFSATCFLENVIQHMFNRFQFEALQQAEFKCLGWDLQQHPDHITVDQIDLCPEKDQADITTARIENEDELTEAERSKPERSVRSAEMA